MNKNIKTKARLALQGNYSYAVLNYLGFVIITLFINLLPGTIFGTVTSPIILIIEYAMIYLLSVLTNMLLAGFNRGMLGLARNEERKTGTLFSAFRENRDQFLKLQMLLISINMLLSIPVYYVDYRFSKGLISLASYALTYFIGTLAALLVTTIITLPISMAVYLLIDEPGCTFEDSLKKSIAITKGKLGEIFSLKISFAGMFILGILSFGIGLLWVMPYYYQSMAQYYAAQTSRDGVTGSSPN